MAEFIVGIADFAKDAIDELIRTYAVEDLIRCRDCKHRGTWQCWQYFLGHKTEDDWFCKDGEKR